MIMYEGELFENKLYRLLFCIVEKENFATFCIDKAGIHFLSTLNKATKFTSEKVHDWNPVWNSMDKQDNLVRKHNTY